MNNLITLSPSRVTVRGRYESLITLTSILSETVTSQTVRVVIPSEREGSQTDFSLRSKQGFLAALEMTREAGHGILAIAPRGEDVTKVTSVSAQS